MSVKNIGVIVGSLRKEAWSKEIAKQLIALAPTSLNMTVIDIGHLPLYNQDYDDADTPIAWRQFRTEVAKQDGILFVTPEYNRSIPAAMKNAIDVGSRPYGKSIWNKKPASIVSLSVGAIGGFGANHHLRQSLICLNILTQPTEMYLGNVADLFDENRQLAKNDTKEFLTKFMKSFADWVEGHVQEKVS